MTTITADAPSDAPAPSETPRAGLSDRARAEQRLGWYLVAPAVTVMLLVTAYPLRPRWYLSLFSYRLTDPGARSSWACATTGSC